MKELHDKASQPILCAVLIMGFVIVVLHAVWAVAACERDPDHTLRQLIDSKVVGLDRVPKDIQPFKLMGEMVEGEIETQRFEGIWETREPTMAFYWPAMNEQFIIFSSSCRYFCTYRIEPTCHIVTPRGYSMFAFRHTDGTLRYVLAGSLVPVPKEQTNPLPLDLLQGGDPFGVKKVPTEPEQYIPRP